LAAPLLKFDLLLNLHQQCTCDQLEKVFQNIAKKSDRLIHIGSTQTNESLNQIISTKVPKAKHFGGSESLTFRVAAGVHCVYIHQVSGDIHTKIYCVAHGFRMREEQLPVDFFATYRDHPCFVQLYRKHI
jgi:hypothetical protein